MFRFMIKFLKWLGIACAIGVLIRVGEVLIIKYNENKVEETQQVAEIINENIVAENINDNKETIENTDVVIENKETKQEEKAEVKEKKEAEQVVVPKITKNTKTNKTEDKQTETKKEEQIIEKQETIEVKEEKQEEKKVEQVVETKKEETNIVKQEEVKQEVITEEYKVNNQMINELKQAIKNNETEDMKNYGYEIVVDSSIVELTNQFTYTEYRVKNKLTYKYGNIRIYARDYYYNGKYITTQCFII